MLVTLFVGLPLPCGNQAIDPLIVTPCKLLNLMIIFYYVLFLIIFSVHAIVEFCHSDRGDARLSLEALYFAN
jgi:hypothetical protein